MNSSFCGYPEMIMAFMFATTASFMLGLTALATNLWTLLGIPVIWVLYFWFFEGIEWKGRTYGHSFMLGGSLAYSGEEYDCHSCKHIQSQLDCKYGSLLTAEKLAHRNDWKEQYPCSSCWRSGASSEQDLYKGPVNWAEGERP